MIGIGIGSYIILPSLFNYIVANYKRNKTIKKIKDCLNEKGYIVDKRMEKKIVRKIMEDYEEEYYGNSEWHIDKAFSFVPILRWILLPFNIKYLCGDYSSLNETYWYYEDIVDYDENVIDFLEECGYIHVDKEKKQWINDRDNALKILEKKYDDNSENNKENVMEIYENDDLEQLKLKRKMLDEMIELKKSQKENDNILEKEIKKQNNDVELDNLSLKYKPDKKKKN